jgi:hypothetical protein
MSAGNEDYAVAWICSLPLEMAAAKVMLDEMHGRLPQIPGDENTYTLGKVCGHNVVVICLPPRGAFTRAAAVSQMRSIFPNIRYGLMVGIGGGVPTPE